ncbi:uncharacterized protein LOC123700387 [Colias croceus]|uniref:uncharacterized protein LOC123700387 n=1 Tax=Colias crocea TaxID=72248 RepID=UPI001E27FE8B|nr:uncharacterized protein LOC123700387 [Colias croceus]
MRRNVSARTKAMLSACLIQISEDENEDYSNEVIEGTPVSSPSKVKKALPVADDKPLLTEKACLFQALTNNQTNNKEEYGGKSVEALPYSLLTTRQSTSQALGFEFKALNEQTTKYVGEKSLDSTAFTPLTPKAQSFDNKSHRQPISSSNIDDPSRKVNPHDAEYGEKSVEAPPYSPLTPRPTISHVTGFECNVLNSKSGEGILEKSLDPPFTPDPHCDFSPLPPMTPKTAELFNILAESLDNENLDLHATEKSAPNSPVSSDITYINSDDSVQDPDYDCHISKNSSDTSDKSSTNSVSLIRNLIEVHEIPTETRNEIEIESTSARQILQVRDTEPNASSQGRPIRGRKRIFGGTLREERKKRKYSNLSYVNYKKQTIEPKVFMDYICNCAKKCQDKITTETKLEEFNKFYSTDSYQAQNMYLVSCIKEKPKKRAYVTTMQNTIGMKNNKTFSREYYLKDILVCKQMFLKTLQTSSKRINTALSKMRNNCLKDRRGRKGGYNSVSKESELFLIKIINKLPTYVSHYRRADSNDAKFLTSDMTTAKIYEIYSEEAKTAGKTLLSFAKFRHIFVTKFNLRTKPLKKDTCNKCDFYKSKHKHASEEEKNKLEEDHQNHIKKAQLLQQELKNNMKLAKEDPTIETITFDLQKTLPLPRISTNIIYYKRQVWVYNLGIHTGSDGQAYCNVWVEGEAGRGSQEVGSCLIKHITEKLRDGVEHLILWSDSCGGQNRNIKLTLMLKALLNDHPTLKQISHRFLESGHSFLPNDTDFGRIECALKHQQRLYTPEDYIRTMKSCKKNKPMIVQRLDKKDFLSSQNLEKKTTNRKKAEDGSKVSWLDTKEIVIKKEQLHSIFMRRNLDEPYIEVNLKKNVRSVSQPLSLRDMDLLWPTGKPISEAKLKDIKSIMHLIPSDAQDFYKKLKSDEIFEDDIDGFSGALDFAVDDDGADV